MDALPIGLLIAEARDLIGRCRRWRQLRRALMVLLHFGT